MQRREYPTDPSQWDMQGSNRLVGRSRPSPDLEALMQLGPHQEADLLSIEATAVLKEVIGEAIDGLPDEDRWIFDRLFVEQLSLRVTGRILGIPKTTLARRRDRIRRHLMAELSESEAVRRWLIDGL